MTKRLYLEDPYTAEFDGEIVERRETAHGPALVLAATYFYPETGGQPFDLGTIEGLAVTAVVETEDDTILHFVERFPGATRVRCSIDWPRRFCHMQQHSGQHILSAAFVKETSAQTTSFHLGARFSTIDLDHGRLSEEEIRRAERAANDVVRRAVPIRSRIVSADRASELDLRKPPPDAPSLRIVDVEGFDSQACCGTHPRSSAEVGPIVVRGFEKFKGGTRVEFLCGDRALDDYRVTIGRVRALASVLSSSEPELVVTAEKLQEERKSQGKELSRLKSEALLVGAESLMEEAERVKGVVVLVKELEGVGASELRALAIRLTEKPRRVALLGAGSETKAHLVFACSDDVPELDADALLRKATPKVGGKGGGSSRIAQGGGPHVEGLPSALTAAREEAKKLGL